MELKCLDACIICDIDGFRGRNDNGGVKDEGDLPVGFCTSINHNIQWIGFVANSADLEFTITVTNCEKGAVAYNGGLEAGIFEVESCQLSKAVPKSNCNTSMLVEGLSAENGVWPFTAFGLETGNYYYLAIDGDNGDICDYVINVTKGTTAIPQITNSGGLRGPDRVCNGPQSYNYKIDPVPGATYYDWSLNGAPYGREKDLAQTLSFATDGNYELCIQASNICNTGPKECLTIRVGDFPPTRIQRTGCPGVPVVVEGTTITASGNYPYTFKNTVDCDSTIIYEVTIGDAIDVIVDTTICAGPSAIINGTQITTAGDYSFTTQTAAGCDSTITYRVALSDVLRGTASLSICAGISQTVHGRVITGAGSYDIPLKTAQGCDSIVTYTVTTIDPARGIVELVLCPGVPRTIRGQVISEEGTYTFPLRASNGCDSIVTYIVTVTDTLRGSADLFLCPGVPITVHGQVISTGGTYDVPLKTASGCDSIVTYTVTETEALRGTADLVLCPGVPKTVHGQVISETGTYEFVLPAASGCDSIVTYTVTVTDTLRSSETLAICSGAPITIQGQVISAAGTYDFPFKTADGCDSIVTYTVTETEALRGTASLVLCPGVPKTVHGQVLSEAGTYEFVLPATSGCDSIVTYTVTVTDTLRSSETLAICSGAPITIQGQVISAAGTYDFPFKTADGCDSIVTYTVTETEALRGTADLVLCPGVPRTVHGQVLSEAGTYEFPLPAANGCDSIVTYSVTVTDTLRGTEDIVLCPGVPRTIYGQTISAPGSYDFILRAAGGCDSIATYRVSVTDTLRGGESLVLCPGERTTIYDQLISAAGTYRFPLTGTGGCDSIATYTVTFRTPILTKLDTAVCVGQPVRFDGRDLLAEGVYLETRTAASGCDSVVELTLSYKSCAFSATAETRPATCSGASDGSILAYVVGLASPYTVSYVREGGTGSTPVGIAADSTPTFLLDLLAGTYVLTFADRFGGEMEVTVTVGSPSAVRARSRRIADGAFDIRCAGSAEGQVLALASGGTAPYAFRWSDGSTDAQRAGLPAGTYGFIVTDARGCSDSTGVTLTEPPRLRLEIQAIDQGCDPALEPGGVRILTLNGGRAGYQIQLNGLAAGPLKDRYTLDPGVHTVTLRDAVNCRTDTSFAIDALVVPEAQADTVWRIRRGEFATLGVRTSADIVSYFWEGPTELSCEFCPKPRVSPLRDATYTVTVTNVDGCEARTEALVLVLVDRNMYAPTAISPNGDRVNDGFTVYVADEGSVIEELQVFDRWGEQLFVATDIAPGDTDAGWPGTYRGKEMNAGVYVYWARVRNSDGVTELVRGDFTLMR